MAIKTFKYFDAGVGFKDQAADNITTNGVIYRNGTKLKAYIENAARELVTTSQSQVLTNKTIDADLNTISNIEVADFKAGVIDTDLNAVSGADDTIPSAKAVKDYVDQQILTEDEADEIAYDNTISGLAATNVQAAIDEVEARVDTVETNSGNNASAISNHLSDASDAHDASAISNVPSGNLAATDVQTALNELQGDIDTANTNIGTANTNLTNHLNDASDAHDASAISNIPAGNLAATDVQAALNELQSDVDLRALTTNGSIITPTRLDVKQDTKANLTTYALTATNGQIVFATDTKEYFAIKDGLLSDLGGGGGIASVDILSAETADKAAIGDFTQTGLEILETPVVLHGLKSFRLQHATSIKSFKKIIPVDRKFRGKNNTISLDVVSTATSGNLNIIFRDETNSVNLGVSQAIATGSQAITATTANASNQLTGMTNSVLNSLKVGMVITGSAIPVGTTITAISSTTATMSQNATGVSTGIRVSDLVAKKSFSVDIPANCQSFSWAISTVVEAATESYIDDVVVQLTSAALSSTSITVPKNNDTDWIAYTPTFTAGFGTPSSVSAFYKRNGANLDVRVKFTTGTVAASAATISLPSGLTTASTIATLELVGMVAKGNAIAFINQVIVSPSDTVMKFSGQGATNAGLTVYNGNDIFVSSTAYSVQASIPIAGWSANETETKTIPLTSAQLVQQSDAILRVSAPVRGSTNTAVYYFPTITESSGDLRASFTGDAVNGSALTILESGFYAFSFSLSASAGVSFTTTGITKNSTTLTTSPDDHTAATLLAVARDTDTGSAIGKEASVSWSGPLVAGDVIRFMGSPSNTTMSAQSQATISRIGGIRQLNVSSDSKIQIPTHQLRFEGASSRGSTDTAIVKFDTQAITQGDAWDVVNTAANGTVVTMKKAGTINITTSLSVASGNSIFITKNQASLTAAPATSAETLAVNASDTNSLRTSVSYSGYVNIGDKIRIVCAGASPSANNNNNLNLSLTENSIPANFSNVLPQWSQSDSAVEISGANGFGSTATLTRRFSNNPINVGSSVTYTDSATLGAQFLINEDGIYSINYIDVGNTVTDVIIRVNGNIKATDTTAGNNYRGNAAISLYLVKGDIVTFTRDSANTGTLGAEARAAITKVGKPNLTSVDVTPFVNMKTTDVEAIEATGTTSTFGSTNTGVPVYSITKNTNNGIIQVISNSVDGTSFKVLKDCRISINAVAIGGTGATAQITKNSTNLVVSGGGTGVLASGVVQSQASGGDLTISFDGLVNANDVIRLQRNSVAGLTGFGSLSISATADNNATAAPTQQVSSDTIPFVFKATAINPDTDPVGTFNTYTYAANTNTKTISASAPTQSVSDMGLNGLFLTGRAYNAASNTTTPARFEVFLGKGLKNVNISAFNSTGKTSPESYDYVNSQSDTAIRGAKVFYSESTGILVIDTAEAVIGSNTQRFATHSSVTGYFTINASKSPSLVTIPNLNPRIATLTDVKASGSAGGTFTSGAWQTRTLNTLVDTTGIVTSLASNQFILPAGTYYITATAPGYNVDAHKAKLRNITDSTDALIGSSQYTIAATTEAMTNSIIMGTVTITSAKTFELQHRCSATNAVGFGVSSGFSVSEIYSQITIQKVK
jgi:hypothetical protein